MSRRKPASGPPPATSPASTQALSTQTFLRAAPPTQPLSADLRGEGLLHDARNLVSAIGLYCDLLSMPGVLKPEHRQYPEELRLLGTRSRVLIEHLMRSLISHDTSQSARRSRSNPPLSRPAVALQHLDRKLDRQLDRQLDRSPDPPLADSLLSHPDQPDRDPYPGPFASIAAPVYPSPRATLGLEPNLRPFGPGAPLNPVSLRATVERCSGLLSRVANGRPIEVTYGIAADVPVWVTEEAIERILVNLVRNASQALDRRFFDRGPDASPDSAGRASIRIAVGPIERIGESRSWPFQHVRLMVEDSGCGIEPDRLRALLAGPTASSRTTHGIGFRVVRDLVAASNGDLRAASTPGIGTRIQIEWPIAASAQAETDGDALTEPDSLAADTLPMPAPAEHSSIPAFAHAAQAGHARTGAY